MQYETHYETRLEHALAELEGCGDIAVERRPPYPELTPERLALLADTDLVLDRIAARWRTRLDDVLRPYHFAADEYHAAWTTADGRVRGEFCLRNIHDCLIEADMPLTDESLGPDGRWVLPALRLFDEAPHGGAGAVSGLRMPPAGGGPEIWHHVSTRNELHRLDLDYGTYLETLLITKGTWGWHHLFADVDLTDVRHHDAVDNLTAMFETFPVLFPEHDYEPLRARLHERR